MNILLGFGLFTTLSVFCSILIMYLNKTEDSFQNRLKIEKDLEVKRLNRNFMYLGGWSIGSVALLGSGFILFSSGKEIIDLFINNFELVVTFCISLFFVLSVGSTIVSMYITEYNKEYGKGDDE